MSEQPDQPPTSPDDGGAPLEPGPGAGEQMARKVVQDVAAFEVDPPPPARARDAGQGGDEPPT